MQARGESARPERILLFIATGVVAFLLVWFQWRLLFLGFAGQPVSIFLHTIARWIQRRTPLNPLLACWGSS
jgi:predicted PurR-regulated permease PerM